MMYALYRTGMVFPRKGEYKFNAVIIFSVLLHEIAAINLYWSRLWLVHGLVKFIPSVSYHLCLNLPVPFSQPTMHSDWVQNKTHETLPQADELEGNGPKDSRAKVISDSELGLKFEIRILNYPGNHVHIVATLSLRSSNGKQTAEGKQTADIKINS